MSSETKIKESHMTINFSDTQNENILHSLGLLPFKNSQHEKKSVSTSKLHSSG